MVIVPQALVIFWFSRGKVAMATGKPNCFGQCSVVPIFPSDHHVGEIYAVLMTIEFEPNLWITVTIISIVRLSKGPTILQDLCKISAGVAFLIQFFYCGIQTGAIH